MPVPTQRGDDWSDSDGDECSDVETSVLLGLLDGKIEQEEDLRDAAVSRLGGHPAFLFNEEPSISHSQCRNCSFPMELLVQLWCPFEESNMDRALYIFGCARGECQHRPGCVRAFRGLRYNAKYAAKLEKKRQKAKQREEKVQQQKEGAQVGGATLKSNPFSLGGGNSQKGGLFSSASMVPPGNGLGSQLFSSAEVDSVLDDDHEDGAAPPPPESDSEPDDDGDSDLEGESTIADAHSDSEDSLLAAPANLPASTSPWLAAPSYKPAYYLSTATEYVPPAPRVTIPKGSLDDDREASVGKSKKGQERADKETKWVEGYEDSMEVDKVFERFTRVVGYENEQCIRYELGGSPLPFSRDPVFDLLFPSSSAPYLCTTADSASTDQRRRLFDPKSPAITPCPRCKGPRVFECQLMPRLISILQATSNESAIPRRNLPVSQLISDSTDRESGSEALEKRRREIADMLRKGEEGRRSLEWGTVMVFSCASDCTYADQGEQEAKEVWAEELVLIQWEG